MKSLVDVLHEASKKRGLVPFIFGHQTVEAIDSYVIGYSRATVEAGVNDFMLKRFLEWLKRRGEYPTEGWAKVMLEKSGGDTAKAVNLFLDRVDQFLNEGM